MAGELWDAYDREGKPLGFDLVRGKPMPKGVYHLVAEVCAVTCGGRILVTQRHPAKSWGLCWEITGGSVLKGETPLQGAVRELREETGISMPAARLRPFYTYEDGSHTIYHSYITIFDLAEQAIRLQEGETVDYRLLPVREFKRFILTGAFTDGIRSRFLAHEAAFDRIVAEEINSIGSKREDHGDYI